MARLDGSRHLYLNSWAVDSFIHGWPTDIARSPALYHANLRCLALLRALERAHHVNAVERAVSNRVDDQREQQRHRGRDRVRGQLHKGVEVQRRHPQNDRKRARDGVSQRETRHNTTSVKMTVSLLM